MKYYVFSQEEIAELKELFLKLPLNGDGLVSKRLLNDFIGELKEGTEVLTLSDIYFLKKQVNEELSSGDELIDLGEFLKIISRIKAREDGVGNGPPSVSSVALSPPSPSSPPPPTQTQKSIYSISTAAGSTHTYSIDERNMFAHYINNMAVLRGDEVLKEILPIEEENFFKKFSDGVLLFNLVNAVKPGTLSLKKFEPVPPNKFRFAAAETLATALQGCKRIGISLTNIGPEDFIDCREHLVLAVVWQLLKVDILSQVALNKHPELCRLVKENESLESLAYIPAEQILIRWVNHHLKKAGYPKQISNFGSDMKNSEVYTILLQQIPGVPIDEISNNPDLKSRAEKVINICNSLGCDVAIGPQNIIEGNDRLNLALVASLFHKHSGMDLPSESELAELKSQNAMLKKRLEEMEEKVRSANTTTTIRDRASSGSSSKKSGLFEKIGHTIDSGLQKVDEKYHIVEGGKKVKEELSKKVQQVISEHNRQSPEKKETKEEKRERLEKQLADLKAKSKKK
eukprot:TRINITY_DN2431_c0_g1_i20.p2 TRINITY_DN2431_c0_g1~~TRINITY_DN2431_c0_g1_i20.p2  ORF type:complete len:514 (+),score=110.07 TRINITY_DN2431_c0_g1_i20:2231-3772(+)